MNPTMRNRLSITNKCLPLVLALSLIASCSHDGYETGDGNYSYLRADFALLNINSETQATGFVTDDDRSFTLNSPITISNAKADTVYRALVYYNESETSYTDLRSIQTVYVCHPKQEEECEEIYTDPIGLQSTWFSANGTYFNMAINLKVGVEDEDDDEDSYQTIAVVMTEADEESGKYTLTFYHNQNGVPQYYTSTKYVSIPIDGYFESGDSLSFVVNTYDGTETKSVVVP